jgi:hypothetical protein
MMLPRRWRIFQLLNYLQIGCAAAFAGKIFYIFWDDPYNKPDLLETIIYALPFMIFPAVMIIYACINLRLVRKYYPDLLPGVTLATLLDLVPVVAALVIVAHGIAGALLLYAQLYTDKETTLTAYLVLFYFIIVFITGIYTIWQQVALQNTISRNHALNNRQTESNPETP